MSISKKDNALLHLAVVVGYARACLSRAKRYDLADAVTYSYKHLDLSDFADLSQELRGAAEFEIFELLKDGCLLPNQGQDLVAAVLAHDYAECWNMANYALYRARHYDRVNPVDLKPEWLA